MAWAAAVANTPTSNKVTGFSGEVMDTSNAAVLPKDQLGSKMSAGVHVQRRRGGIFNDNDNNNA